jgi:hypothetical protein
MNAATSAPETLDARKARLAALRRKRAGLADEEPTRMQDSEPEPPADVALHHAAVEAAISALKIETQARLAEIPVTLKRMIAKARRGNPDKRDQRIRDATRWADDAQTILLQSLAGREAELLTGLRTLELASLEARRGGSVRTEVRDIETPILKNGAPVWRRGRKLTKRERITRPIVSRDGLESLANSHLGADGEVRRYPDGSPYAPGIDPIFYAAGIRYRTLYEFADPERGLKAVDTESSGRGRAPGDPWDSVTVWAIQNHADANGTILRIEREVRADLRSLHGPAQAEKGLTLLREVAGKGSTIYSLVGSGGPATRAIALLNSTLYCLAVRFGLL